MFFSIRITGWAIVGICGVICLAGYGAYKGIVAIKEQVMGGGPCGPTSPTT